MKNLTDRDLKYEVIPDPVEWVNEHHFLAGLLGTATYGKPAPTQAVESDGHSHDDFDQDWHFFRRAQDLIKASYREDNWQHLENYLLGWKG